MDNNILGADFLNELFDLNNSIVLLKKKLDTLASICPIKSKSNLKVEFGYIVEEFLGLSKNDLSIADYEGIEIKCRKHSSPYPLKLFTCVVDGNGFFLTNEIFKKHSKTVIEKKKRSFNYSFYASRHTRINKNAYGYLTVDYINKRILLTICSYYSLNNDTYYWDFKEIYERVKNKLYLLSIIEYNTEYINRNKYYNVDNYQIYKIRGFLEFLKLIETGIIHVTFSMDSIIDDQGVEHIHNHGIGFYIKYDNLHDLFVII